LTVNEEYQIFLEQVNKLTERRQAVTRTYLSVNAAVIGAMAFLFRDIQMPGWAQWVSALFLLLCGVVACDLWRRLIAQYSTLLGWWYEQLRALEDAMSESNKLITREYDELYLKKQGKVRIGLTRYETRLTWLFTVLYVAFCLSLLITLILDLI